MDQFALISDVHGNRWALEAVLDDIDRVGVSDVLNLGDCLYGPLDPRGTAEILVPRSFATVRGNQDRVVVDENAVDSSTLAFVRGQLTTSHLEWLRGLRSEFILDNVFLCHGSPGSDSSYLLWHVGESGAFPRSSLDVAANLPQSPCELFLCGHDHVPGVVQLSDGCLVINPGSVGLPAYSDDSPFPHVMQTGTPHARYSVITRGEKGWHISDRAVPYDWQAAVDAALGNERPDWAEWLSTGQAVTP